MKKFTSLLVFALIMQSVCAQTMVQTAKLNEYFDRLTDHDKFMGGVSVAQNGQTIYSTSTGFADVEAKEKTTSSTKYKIGSISKTFTATLVFQSVENEKLTLEQTLQDFFPEVINADRITVAQLLAHRSGIPNFLDEGYEEWSTAPKTEKEMLKLIAGKGSDFEPDNGVGYSNSNYLILSYVLEKVYKMNFARILEKLITRPLNLKNTYLGKGMDPQRNESLSYSYFGRWVEKADTHPSVLLGAAAIVSTPEDLNLFYDGLFSGKLISISNLEKMKAHGMGLMSFPFYDQVSYGHFGNIDGFDAVSMYFPSDNLVLSMTSNGCNYVFNTISHTVLSLVYNKPVEFPVFPRITLTSEELDPYLGTYSTPGIPVKVTFTKREGVLLGQVTGQSAVGLDAVKNNTFVYEKESIYLEFDLEKGTVNFKQGGGELILQKE